MKTYKHGRVGVRRKLTSDGRIVRLEKELAGTRVVAQQATAALIDIVAATSAVKSGPGRQAYLIASQALGR